MHKPHSSPQPVVTLPKRNDEFEFGPPEAPVRAIVTRVSELGRGRWPTGWAEMRCVAPGGLTWTKRYRLPLADGFRPVAQ